MGEHWSGLGKDGENGSVRKKAESTEAINKRNVISETNMLHIHKYIRIQKILGEILSF